MAFGWDDLAVLVGPLLGGIFGGGGGGGGGSSPTSTAEQRALQQQMLGIIQQQQGYMSQMDPLRESMARMAMGMLPRRYQTDRDFRVSPGSGASGAGGAGDPFDPFTGEQYGQDAGFERPSGEEMRPGDPISRQYQQVVESYFGPRRTRLPEV